MSAIDERLMTLLVQQTGKPRSEITADARLEDLGIESLDRFELALEIEEEFGFDFPDDEALVELGTVQDLVDLVMKLEAAA